MKKHKQSISFQKLVEFLKDLGYSIKTTFVEPWEDKRRPGYWYARIDGKSITGGFCELNHSGCYVHVNGRIAFDHVKCFDKWSKCPVSLELPQTMKDFEYIVDQLKYVGSEEGFEKSNSYDLNIRDYPYSTHVLCPECRGQKKVDGLRILKPTKANPYGSTYKKCPKCKGLGKVKRPKNV